MNEKEIIVKLLAIASTQQKIIHKLAQTSPADPNLSYLERVAASAATNTGLRTPISAFVKANIGTNEGDATIESTYNVIISGMETSDNPTKEKFMTNYKNQVKAQKPELDGKINIIFA
jgi:hypothetical protein